MTTTACTRRSRRGVIALVAAGLLAVAPAAPAAAQTFGGGSGLFGGGSSLFGGGSSLFGGSSGLFGGGSGLFGGGFGGGSGLFGGGFGGLLGGGLFGGGRPSFPSRPGAPTPPAPTPPTPTPPAPTPPTPAPPGAPADGREPVVFVHGLFGSPDNFDTMVERFRAAGYSADELVGFGYSSTGDMTTAAEQLSAEVDRVLARTGAERVDIVTHSLGGLPSRWYIKFLGGTEKVDDWVSLGGPNQGGGRGTCPAPGSTACSQVTQGAQWVTQLNAGDQTPGDVSYTTFASQCDNVVDAAWTPVEGGDNRSTPSCLSHFALVNDATLIDQVVGVVSD